MATSGRKINYMSQARYEVLSARYARFHDAMNDPREEVVRVFDPLTVDQLSEIELIREVSRELQKKKQEDGKKTAAQAVNEHKVAPSAKEQAEALTEQKQ